VGANIPGSPRGGSEQRTTKSRFDAGFRIVRRNLGANTLCSPRSGSEHSRRRSLPRGHSPLCAPFPAARVFCGRDAELRALSEARAEGGIVCLEGIGGIGKTALLAEYLRACGEDGFAWSFYVQADADAFLSALAAWLQVAPGTSVLAEVKTRGQFLLVLDGFERMQSDEPPHEVRDESLRHFLERCAGIGAGAACLCASRLPLTLDAPVRAIALHGLESDDAVALLQARGLPAS